MPVFKEEITINAPAATVWAVLADIGTIGRWNPGLRSSERINAVEGLGAQRTCIISKSQWLSEEVIAFLPHKEITFQIIRTSLPFEAATIQFTLFEGGSGTRVTLAPRYTLNYGVFGRLMDALMVRSAYRKGMVALLEGLKQHVEALPVMEALPVSVAGR